MAKYHITIRDNDAGNVVTDCETSCIIGAYFDDDTDNVATLAAISCTCDKAGLTTYCAAKAVQLAQEKHPEIAALVALRSMVKQRGGNDD